MMKNYLVTVFILLLFAVTPVLAIGGVTFSKTSASYDSGMTYSELNAAVKNELGSNYEVADWNDIDDYVDGGGDISDLKSFEDTMLTRNGKPEYSSGRQYYIDWSDRSGQTPYDSFLSHANIGQMHLGSWSLSDRSILAVNTGSSGSDSNNNNDSNDNSNSGSSSSSNNSDSSDDDNSSGSGCFITTIVVF